MKKILVLHGPNLNLLGQRECEIYGNLSLEEINNTIIEEAKKYYFKVDTFQSNYEGAIIEKLQIIQNYNAVIINPAALGHYSIALLDAVKIVTVPVIEVHLTNIYAREDFRKVSVLAPYVKGQVTGFGVNSYLAALYLLNNIFYGGK